jgi:hypothetical protein
MELAETPGQKNVPAGFRIFLPKVSGQHSDSPQPSFRRQTLISADRH